MPQYEVELLGVVYVHGLKSEACGHGAHTQVLLLWEMSVLPARRYTVAWTCVKIQLKM